MPRLTRDLFPTIPASWSERDHTIDVVWSTGARVRRIADGREFLEVLDLGGARLDRLNLGAPFLRCHDATRISNVLGAVVPGSARIESGQGVATIRLSSAPQDRGAVMKIADGVLRHVSVGYMVHRAVRAGEAGGVPVIRVVDFEPHEISAVPIPGDPGAHIRLMQMAAQSQNLHHYSPAALARARMTNRVQVALMRYSTV